MAQQLTFLEFFAGIGLMRMGLEMAGWRAVFANDIDQQKLAMYQAHFAEGFTLGDIHTLNSSNIPDSLLATASFPCNDLSLAGARSGLDGKHSSAFWGFCDVLQTLGDRKPSIVMLENVTGFLTSNNGEDFLNALRALNQLGYGTDAFIIDAALFVPQSRQRLFIVGVLHQEQQTLPEENAVRPRALMNFFRKHAEVRWNFRHLPAPIAGRHRLQDILEDLPPNAREWWDQNRATYLLKQMSHRHRAIAEFMIARKNYSYGTVFRRVRNHRSMAELRVDGIAGCLRTPRGGSGRQILFKAGRGEYFARLLTPRECARLMGAGEFTITVPLNQALFGFGDAVCVPVIEWIATNYLNPLADEVNESTTLMIAESQTQKKGPRARLGLRPTPAMA